MTKGPSDIVDAGTNLKSLSQLRCGSCFSAWRIAYEGQNMKLYEAMNE